jgi:hypothetical protein
LLVAGLGEHGVSRLRGRRSGDPVPTTYDPDYWEGEQDWNRGGVSGAHVSFAVKYGWDGHNILGFRDAWGLRGNESDREIFDYFQAPDDLRADRVAGPRWAEFVRLNARQAVSPAPVPQEALAVAVDRSAYRVGDVMRLEVRATGGVVNEPADAYVALQLPAGGLLALQTNGSLLPTLFPLVRNVTVPTITVPFAFQIPPGAPVGSYVWLGGLTRPGSLSLLAPLSTATFQIVP